MGTLLGVHPIVPWKTFLQAHMRWKQAVKLQNQLVKLQKDGGGATDAENVRSPPLQTWRHVCFDVFCCFFFCKVFFFGGEHNKQNIASLKLT